MFKRGNYLSLVGLGVLVFALVYPFWEISG